MEKLEILREELNQYLADGHSLQSLLPLSREIDRLIVTYMMTTIEGNCVDNLSLHLLTRKLKGI